MHTMFVSDERLQSLETVVRSFIVQSRLSEVVSEDSLCYIKSGRNSLQVQVFPQLFSTGLETGSVGLLFFQSALT